MKGGNAYMVRPVHKAVRFFKYFLYDDDKKLRTAIVADPDTDPVGKKHSNMDTPSTRYGMYVIDRADQKLKIMEFPAGVFREFNDRYILNKKPPGSMPDGGDWQIKVEGQGLNTKYRCQYVEDAPISKEGLEKIKGLIKNTAEEMKLPGLFKANTPEEIEKRLFGDWEEVYGKKNSDNPRSDNPGKEEKEVADEMDPEDLW